MDAVCDVGQHVTRIKSTCRAIDRRRRRHPPSGQNVTADDGSAANPLLAECLTQNLPMTSRCFPVIARSALVRRSPPSGEGGCDEAIHRTPRARLDCFAALAMTCPNTSFYSLPGRGTSKQCGPALARTISCRLLSSGGFETMPSKARLMTGRDEEARGPPCRSFSSIVSCALARHC